MAVVSAVLPKQPVSYTGLYGNCAMHPAVGTQITILLEFYIFSNNAMPMTLPSSVFLVKQDSGWEMPVAFLITLCR